MRQATVDMWNEAISPVSEPWLCNNVDDDKNSDVEDQAAKISVEEQMQLTTIQTLTKEIDLARSETKRLKEDSDVMKNAKGDICSKIIERQRKIALLENDSSTLSQTLELIQQEKVNLSTKLVEKRTSYGKTEDELGTKLKEQQDWLNNYKSSSNSGQHSLVHATCEAQDDAYKNMVTKIDAAKAKFDNLTQMRSELASERHKVKQSLEELKCRMESYEPKLRDMSTESLAEEVQALLSDKSGETEYQESMQSQIDTIKEISHMVKCGCGEEYKVEVDLCV
ncbi:hypothetical protein M8C21_013877 [Ambrosia artemisiifolia]|uniref:Uncharacterized protein n=1 Tax=Ambrosia artemisiifolia TaxID=4212 RepID=A0AAD5CBI6_AMBAR|nr:hypothetical protein M8C21_013877 [Ambrosia artemisiifolia]